jgi:hypothetical protein
MVSPSYTSFYIKSFSFEGVENLQDFFKIFILITK